MKPTIIFKDGREGEMTLDAIEGIKIQRLDGEEILVYPKYSEEEILYSHKIEDWNESIYDECDALHVTDREKEITDGLLALDSPAAKYVRSVGEKFNIPNLLSVAAIRHQRKQIDALAAKIKGADRIGGSHLWSCLRLNPYGCWYANGGIGYFHVNSLFYTYVVVPVSHLKKARE